MPRRILFLIPLFVLGAFIASSLLASQPKAEADVAAVGASSPRFAPNSPVTITVVAEDDDGPLKITSDLPGSTLTVTNCAVQGGAQVAGLCDGSGMANVSGQGSRNITIQTNSLDTDDIPEALTVTLTLVASCDRYTVVTISADQDGNANDDLITIDCEPATPTPTPTLTPTATATATITPSPVATSTGVPATSTPVPPTNTPVSQVLSSGITPPSTGSAGLQ